MQIAEEIEKGGVTAGTAFKDAITYLVAKEGLSRIIETGTYHGTGTTDAIIKGIQAHGQFPVAFVSIEVNDQNFRIALKNTAMKPVHILKGLSIPRSLLPPKESIRFDDYPESAIVDHQQENRAELYYNETDTTFPDNLLDQALEYTDYKPELVVLDSAGHIGTIEWEYLMAKIKGSCYLALDDTNHVKHLKTVEQIQTDSRYTLVFDTQEKFGSRIYQFTND